MQASPLELRAARRQHFQRRMSRHWLRLQEEAGGALNGTEGGEIYIYTYVCICIYKYVHSPPIPSPPLHPTHTQTPPPSLLLRPPLLPPPPVARAVVGAGVPWVRFGAVGVVVAAAVAAGGMCVYVLCVYISVKKWWVDERRNVWLSSLTMPTPRYNSHTHLYRGVNSSSSSSTAAALRPTPARSGGASSSASNVQGGTAAAAASAVPIFVDEGLRVRVYICVCIRMCFFFLE